MNSDSKSSSRLKDKFITIAALLLVVIAIITIAVTRKKTKVANLDNSEESSMQEISNTERDVQTASRSADERIVDSAKEEVVEDEEEKEQYISIEEIKISKDMDLTKRCGISKEDFRTLLTNLKADTSGFFEENADTIYDLCEKYEVNEIFYCGLIGAEAGFNISSGHRNKHNYISMMSKGGLIRYATVEEGLEAGLKLLHNNYLTPGGSCYSGKTLSAVKKRFCPNSSTWVNLVYTCMRKIV